MVVMIDLTQTGNFDGQLLFGTISGACAALDRSNFHYTIKVENNCTEVADEQFLRPIELPELEFITPSCRDVAVWVESHGNKLFYAKLVRRDVEHLYKVMFEDGNVLDRLSHKYFSAPDERTLHGTSPITEQPDPLWLQDRKIQANIDLHWPMEDRVRDCLTLLRTCRPFTMPPLCGPFVGKNMVDSEGYPCHPAPSEDLAVDGYFVNTWAKYAGKVKFATTYKIGPRYPRFDAWVDSVDAGDPLYFHAALPVHAGLICLGLFQGQPEWVRASDVALIGIALYVNGEFCPGFLDPPLDLRGMEKYGHESCAFIPGCVETFMVDSGWVGGTFCLAPQPNDFEIRDDIYAIQEYHRILKECSQRFPQELLIEINLVLTTNYVANVRQVCCGAIRVALSDNGLKLASERIEEVRNVKMTSQAALCPHRPRKLLSEITLEQRMATQISGNQEERAVCGTSNRGKGMDQDSEGASSLPSLAAGGDALKPLPIQRRNRLVNPSVVGPWATGHGEKPLPLPGAGVGLLDDAGSRR